MNPNTPQQPNEQPEVPVTPPTEPTVPPSESFAPEATTPTPEAATPVASPFAASTEPTPSVFGTAPAGPTTPAPAPGSKNTKKLIIIASAIGGAVLLAILAVVVFIAMTTVSKQDYAAAATQYNEVSSANSSLLRSVSALSSSSSSTDAEFNEDVKAAEEALANLQTQNDELGNLKAVKVGDGKALYATFNDKLDAYVVYANDLLVSVKAIHPAILKCDAVSDADDVAGRVAALKDCSTAFNAVGDIPNAEFKTFVDVLKTGYADYATAYESMAAITDPYGDQYDQYREIRDKVYEVQDTISAASTKFSTDINARDDELSVQDSATALADYLNAQQRK